MSLSPGTRLGSFEIVASIGSGRLGEVYRALDTKLDRVVAIKVLSDNSAIDAEWLDKFKQEVSILTSLSHSNIGAVYGLQEEDGVRFLVLEFVVGVMLSDRIKQGPIIVKKALPMFIRIARALKTAHENGIVHGDLKPANIKMTAGEEIKVLDFGLAKPIETLQSNSSTAVTSDGAMAGMPMYMSPEQARGQAADERTDIWAFGCCLYEVLTGTPPFGGETDSDLIAGILEREPDWDLMPDDLPEVMGDLLRRCLEKESGGRFSGLGEMTALLEEAEDALKENLQKQSHEPKVSFLAWVPIISSVVLVIVGVGSAYFLERIYNTSGSRTREVVVAPVIRSLAVLPFENQSGVEAQQSFVDDMTDALAKELSEASSLTIKSGTSVRGYRGTDKTTREIAQELKVDAVITGSALRDENEVHISLALVDGGTGDELWAYSYARPVDSSSSLLIEIALAIVDIIGAAITPEEEGRTDAAWTADPEVIGC